MTRMQLIRAIRDATNISADETHVVIDCNYGASRRFEVQKVYLDVRGCLVLQCGLEAGTVSPEPAKQEFKAVTSSE